MIKLFLEVSASVSAIPFLIVAWNDASWATALGALVCVFLLRQAKRYAYNAASAEHVKAALEALKSVKRDFTLTRINASQYVDSEVMSFLQFQGANLDLIFTDPKDEKTKLLSSLRAYRDMEKGRKSLIFLGSSKARFSGARSFFLLHEIGHFTPDNYLLTGALNGRWLQAVLALAPSLFLLRDSPYPAFAAIVVAGLVAVWITSWAGSLELSADSFAAITLVRSEGRDFALKVLRGMADQFRRIGSSLHLKNISRSREFFHRAACMDKICEEVGAGNTMDFFGFESVRQWRKHPTYFAVSGIKIAFALIVIVIVSIWGVGIDFYQLSILVFLALGVSVFVVRHEWNLLQIRESLSGEIERIRAIE